MELSSPEVNGACTGAGREPSPSTGNGCEILTVASLTPAIAPANIKLASAAIRVFFICLKLLSAPTRNSCLLFSKHSDFTNPFRGSTIFAGRRSPVQVGDLPLHQNPILLFALYESSSECLTKSRERFDTSMFRLGHTLITDSRRPITFVAFQMPNWLYSRPLEVPLMAIDKRSLTEKVINFETTNSRPPLSGCSSVLIRTCPTCAQQLTDHCCKLICSQCGYFLSCSEFY